MDQSQARGRGAFGEGGLMPPTCQKGPTAIGFRPVPPYNEPIQAYLSLQNDGLNLDVMTPVTVIFLSSQNSQKGPKIPLLLDIPMMKTFQLQGALPLTRRSAPGHRWVRPPVLCYRLALAMCPTHRGSCGLQLPKNNLCTDPQASWWNCCQRGCTRKVQ